MKCEVQPVYRNPRFRTLKIEGQTYILDMSKSIWYILIPFLTWMVPHKVYLVDEEEFNKHFKIPKIHSSKKNVSLFFTAGIGIALGNMLTTLTDYMDLESSLMFNIIIVGTVLFLMFGLRAYFSYRNKRKLYQVLPLDESSQKQLWIRPMSLKHFLKCFSMYVFSLGVSVLFFIVFIFEGHLVPIIVATMFLLLLFVVNVMTVLIGHTTVKFKEKKKGTPLLKKEV
ncbi:MULTISPECIES: DUF443 family protein [Bacillaceae]|uniref:DUF443 domain-containing protein n=1 Tax=Evansella alkalicola TaxID=745819 RepID=A0ABS6JZY0_9BACI|nr:MULTISPECIES: DUF443 family protein [Bacillaceae]MBU9722772.1 DUF443 domain-containing protein [Bacillus alkalicola]